MILVEDIFNDLTDDDIYNSVYTDDSVDKSDLESLFEHLTSKYKHCMTICLGDSLHSGIDIFEIEKIWNILPALFKRINYFLNIYGIEHSEPFVLDKKRFHIYHNDYSKYEICDFKGFNIITLKKEFIYHQSLVNTIYPTIYFNLPKFGTLKNIYKFIVYLTKTIWANEQYRNYFISNKIQSSDDSLLFFCEKPFMYIGIGNIISLKSDKKRLSYTTIRDMIKFIFPEKKQEIDELYANKKYEQLLNYISD